MSSDVNGKQILADVEALEAKAQSADGGDFDGTVPLRPCDQGCHASLDEIDVLDRAVVLLQYGAVFQGDALQMRPQAFE